MKHSIANLLIKSPHILVIEDDAQQLGQMLDWLEAREGLLFQARNAEQAQSILQQQWVDAIITDWQLPGISGLELIRSLREADFAGPLLLCTGMMLTPDHLQEAFAAGASDYLRKPLNRVELNSRLDNSLQLYAHREALNLLNHSQVQFIRFLASHLGQGFQRLLQLQQLNQLTQPPTLLEQEEQQLAQEMVGDFHKLMAWGRYRLSLQQLELQRIELRKLLNSLARNFNAQSERLSLRGGKDLFIHSDLDVLMRILMQLTDNALRYSSGKVTLKVSSEGEQIRFSVSDEGHSLSTGELARLLDIRYTGLGLHICHDLLKLLGSSLQGRTNSAGTTLYFELPQR
ncbi:MAG: hybrid sensor histidine kinase/response regulator [Candidatus Sericytochromatia bacterium]